jgi:hypothetical protein
LASRRKSATDLERLPDIAHPHPEQTTDIPLNPYKEDERDQGIAMDGDKPLRKFLSSDLSDSSISARLSGVPIVTYFWSAGK